jgi:myosin heavy subunit
LNTSPILMATPLPQIDNFNQVKSEYIDEGVDLFDFKLVDNSDTLHLLEGRHGVIVTLNEECLLPKGKDESFVYKVKKYQQKSTKLIDKKLHRPFEFGVEHFAGTVQYDARKFVQTNMDKLSDNIVVAAGRSTNSLIKDEFRKLLAQRVLHGEGSKTSNKKKNEANKTIMYKFQSQLKGLIAAMDGTRTRYIRCVKANASMVPKLTDHVSTMKQLECSGLMTALIISRESFPQKLTYDFILNRYACLMGDRELKSVIVGMEREERVRPVLLKWLKHLSKKNRDGTRTMPFACGKTKVFFKSGAQNHLEHLRRQFYEQSSRTIQTWFRGIIAVKLLAQRRRSIFKIQSFNRMALVKLRLEKHRLASTILCAWIRCRWAVADFRAKRACAVVIQGAARRWKQTEEFQRVRADIVLLQSVFRKTLVRKRMMRLDCGASVISQWIRDCWHRIEIRRQLSAGRIQRLWRSSSVKSRCRAKVRAAIYVQRAWRQYWLRITFLSQAGIEQNLISRAQTSPKDVTWRSSSSLDSIDSVSISMPLSSIEIKKDGILNDIDSIVIDERLALEQKLMETSRILENKTMELEQLQTTSKRRLADLTKANNGLVKEVFKLRQECDLAKKQRRSDALQMDSQFARVQEEMERTRRKNEKKIQSMEWCAIDAQRRFDEEIQSKRREISSMKKTHADEVEKLRDELRKTQVSHQEYLGKLMSILETTQTMREKETAKISSDLRAIKKEKDGQIFMLQQELKAARAAKRIVINDVEPRPLIDAPRMKQEFFQHADDIILCSQEFNHAVEKMTNLIAASHTLPPAVGPHNMTEVSQQQERAQRLMELVGVLADLYSMSEERRTSNNERSLAAIDDYIALSDPDEAIQDLRERLADTELQNERLRNELEEKGHCRKCAVREEAARRRLGR